MRSLLPQAEEVQRTRNRELQEKASLEAYLSSLGAEEGQYQPQVSNASMPALEHKAGSSKDGDSSEKTAARNKASRERARRERLNDRCVWGSPVRHGQQLNCLECHDCDDTVQPCCHRFSHAACISATHSLDPPAGKEHASFKVLSLLLEACAAIIALAGQHPICSCSFTELSKALDPSKAVKSDKTNIIADAIRVVTQLRAENGQLRQLNKFLEVGLLRAEMLGMHCSAA